MDKPFKRMKKIDAKIKSQIARFFERPGINKSGFCMDAGTSNTYVNKILRGTQPATKSWLEKMKAGMAKYGTELIIEE